MRADCASRDERERERERESERKRERERERAENSNANTKSLINCNVTVERNADLIGLMVGHKEWRIVLSGVQTGLDSLQ